MQVVAVAIAFLLMGLAAFVRPATVVAMMGLPATTPDARNEVQAVYGGFGLAVAITLLATMWFPSVHKGVVLAVAAALGGMALGRVIGALRERPGRWPVIFFFVEVAGAAVLLTAL